MTVLWGGAVSPYITSPSFSAVLWRLHSTRPRPRSAPQAIAQDPPTGSAQRNPTPVRNRPSRIPKCKVGDRYRVPGNEFDEDSDSDGEHPEWFYGVVTDVQKTGCKMLFSGDEIKTRYDGFLESWHQYLVEADDPTAAEESIFQAIEVQGRLRRAPRPVVRRVRARGGRVMAGDGDEVSHSASNGMETSDEEGPTEVDEWESDKEDDECEVEPSIEEDDEVQDYRLDAQYARAHWVDVPALTTDPRAATGSMPENITPQFLMPSYRDEPLLAWFLFYMPIGLIVQIVNATNENAKTIAWPIHQPWKPLRTGEFMRWLGLWVLMSIYPVGFGGRRVYWRGLFNFQKYMSEKRFENILRAFTLPQYTKDDPGWGGQGRDHYLIKKFDKFFETRCFTDLMRERFQSALKPGGWLCVDETMFSWLGRALKLPGWKVIKRKPHPFGLESKTTACAVTGVLVDFEFQEGTEPMGHFKFCGETNRSTAWLLRLTEKWHNTEQRTVIADAAFAQVRAAVALYRIGGLYFIGNVKGCTRYFCKEALKVQCGVYERDKLVCVTKKLTLGSGMDKISVYGTGWRCTSDMVVTYVHTGGTAGQGTDRKKRKYIQMSDGKLTSTAYHVKRPKVSSEYQTRMGAIDEHNYRRQSGKGVGSLEKLCVTRNSKDRIFISIVSWILINIYLIQKFFLWGGEAKKTAAELQEQIAMALINNNLYDEQERDGRDGGTEDIHNDPADCLKHPQYKCNLCRFCYERNTIFYCAKCSNPSSTRKVRKEKGPKGGVKHTHIGYMHFCKTGCFDKHHCGNVPRRRTKAQMQSSSPAQQFNV